MMPVYRAELVARETVYISAKDSDSAWEAVSTELGKDFFAQPDEWELDHVDEAVGGARAEWNVHGGRLVFPGNEVTVPDDVPEDLREAWAGMYYRYLGLPTQWLQADREKHAGKPAPHTYAVQIIDGILARRQAAEKSWSE